MTLDDITGMVKAAKDYADCIVKPPLEQLGGLLADTVGLWRLKNRVNVLLKAKAYCEARGVSPTKLLPSVFVPLLEVAGNADDPDLSEMFACLLANHLDRNTQDAVHPAFAQVLSQLSPVDAHVLKTLDTKRSERQQADPTKPVERTQILDVVEVVKCVQPDVGGAAVGLSLINLERLGLADDDSLWTSLTPRMVPTFGWHITTYGRQFLFACSRPGSSPNEIELRLDEHVEQARKSREKSDKLRGWFESLDTPLRET